MKKEEFAAATLDSEYETYIVYVSSLSSTLLVAFNVHISWRPWISGLIAKDAPTKVSAKYSDFTDVFSLVLASELSKHTGINDHAIELVDGCQQPSYGPIYSVELVELDTLKAFIKTNLANGFIKPSKSPADALILFDWKLNGFLRLCVNYQGLNNLTIKNWYPLLLIGELLDRLGRTRQFTQLDFTSAYYRMRIRKADK